MTITILSRVFGLGYLPSCYLPHANFQRWCIAEVARGSITNEISALCKLIERGIGRWDQFVIVVVIGNDVGNDIGNDIGIGIGIDIDIDFICLAYVRT